MKAFSITSTGNIVLGRKHTPLHSTMFVCLRLTMILTSFFNLSIIFSSTIVSLIIVSEISKTFPANWTFSLSFSTSVMKSQSLA